MSKLTIIIVILIAISLAIVFLYGARNKTNITNTTMSTGDKTSWCIGRFGFDLPSNMVMQGRSQRQYLTDLSTIPVPNGSTGEKVWTEEVMKIKQDIQKQKAEHPSSGVGVLKEVNLAPDMPSISYAANSILPDIHILRVAKIFNNHILILQSDYDKGKEDVVQELVTAIAKDYTPGSAIGFCLGAGSIVGDPSQNETVNAALVDSQDLNPDSEARLKFTINTQTVSRPEEFDNSEFKDMGVKVSTKNRTVVELKGTEARMQFSDKGVTYLQYIWQFPGVYSADKGASADEPYIQIRASATKDRQKDLEAAWETALQSLHKIPVK